MSPWNDPPRMSARGLLSATVICIVVAVILLGIAVTSGHCQDVKPSPVFKVTGAALAGLAAVDVAQTVGAVRSGRFVETNPLFKSQASSALVLGAAKAGVVTATWAVSSKLRRQGHRKLAWTVLLSVTAVQASAVAWNARQLAKVGR